MREIKIKLWCPHKKEMSHPMRFGADVTIHLDDVELQWTSLLDKNGKEIYEGDILGYAFPSGVKKICEWKHGHNNTGFNIGRNSTCEVIGNKFENPELLGGKMNKAERNIEELRGEK